MRRTLLAVCLLVMTASARADDWHQWRGPERDGHSAETGLLTVWPGGGPKLLWKVDGLGTGWTSASIALGRVYVTGMNNGQGMLFCYDTGGERLWQSGYGEEWNDGRNFPGSRSTPTVHEGHVYLLSGLGGLFCFDAKTGKKVWGFNILERFQGRNIRWALSESPLIEGGKLIITPGGPAASVVALEPKTGKVAWKSVVPDAGRSAYCSPIAFTVGKTRVIATQLEKQTALLDAKTGKVLWSMAYRNQWAVHSITPTVDAKRGLIYFTSGYGLGGFTIKVGTSGVRKLWQAKIHDVHHGGVVRIGNVVYGASTKRPRNQWVALDYRTGKVVYQDRGVGKGSVISAEGLLYCYGERGGLALVKPTPSGFKTLSEFKIDAGDGQHWAHPSISDGKLYVRHGGSMMVYDIKAK